MPGRVRTCQVLLLADTRALERPLDYRIPSGVEELTPGSLVACPLGPRRLVGMVIGTDPPSFEGRIVALSGLIEAPPVLPELVDLALWTARYYAAPVASCLRLVMPPGAEGALRRSADGTWRLVTPPTGPVPRLHVHLTPGARASGRRKEILAVLDAAGGTLPQAALLRRARTTAQTIARMEEAGLVTVFRGTPDTSASASGGPSASAPHLTAHQAEAVARITAPRGRGAEALLLHGVTGSGKTEVYLRAIEHARSQGRGAIVLAPEISLTPQLVNRLTHRLGDRVALWHSAMSAAERASSYARLRDGTADVVVGARSAVYAPVRNPGVIIVDEEHDSSYKQDNTPRYDARQVAYRRAHGSDAVVIYGSATPRPETWHALERISLPARVDGSSPPRVRVVDMRIQRIGPLSRALVRALRDAAAEGQKAIILLNRRGFALSAACRTCGWVAECPHCDVALVHHRTPPRLVCHHCGYEAAVPLQCPECGSVEVLRAGIGTQGLEEALQRAVPDARVVRLDASSTAQRGALTTLLEEFAAPGPAILVGTQMVAKGHDLSDVTVAAVIDADAGLGHTDFRAEERTFDLIVQASGRAGRRGEPATVIVQALEPEARAVQLAAEARVEEFLEGELERRREHMMPPFSHLVRVVVDGGERHTTIESAQHLATEIGAFEDVDVMGPAPMHRLRDRWRRALLVRSSRTALAVRAVQAVLDAYLDDLNRRDVRVAIDVDPQ